jgi:protein phosphatase
MDRSATSVSEGHQMKICIISDLHANLEALAALPRDYDELWVVGDLVNYGPNPAEAIEFVRSRASLMIRGNHDNAIGYEVDCRCSPRFRAMAEATGDYTRSVLSPRDKQFLRDLPTCASRELSGTKFFLCHATPSDYLWEYRPSDSPLWRQREAASSGADVVLTGHTHLQFRSTFGKRTVVNPGSLGQSKMGDGRARYALWHDGRIELRALDYPVDTTVAKIRSLPFPDPIKSELAIVLLTGKAPAAP